MSTSDQLSLPNNEQTDAKRYHHGKLKSALVDTALAFISENTYESLSLRKLAALLGVNQTALYSHFKNKNALLAELAKHGFKQLIAESQRVFNQGKSAEENLAIFANYYLSFARKNPELFKLMFGTQFSHLHPASPGLWEIAEDSFLLFQKVIDDYLKATQSQHSNKLATLTVWSFMHGFVHLVIGDRLGEESLNALDNQQLMDQLLTIIKTGLNN